MTGTPKRSVWKILTIVAAVLVALVGSAALWIRSTADRKFAAMEERLRTLEAEALTPDPAPRPGTVPGDAWDDYVAALNNVWKLQSADKLMGILNRTQNADVAFGEAALAAHGSAVDLIMSGSRRASCVPPGRTALPGLWQWQTAIRLAILKARNLQAGGNMAGAVEILLALCRFGRDLSQSGLPSAGQFPFHTLEMTLEELRVLIQDSSLSPDLVARVDSELAILDESFPSSERMRKQLLQLIAEFNRPIQNSGFGVVLRSWRFGFSPRLLEASSFERWDDWFTRSRVADALPWPQAQSLIGKIQSEIDQTRFLGRDDLPSVFLTEGSLVRSTRAHLRLLRTAAHYRATGQVLDLDDPFGTKLLRQENGGRLKIWSVGKDGTDQKGVGNWDSRPIEDIVLEVPR